MLGGSVARADESDEECDGVDVPEIDVAELARRIGDGATLLDVREVDEWTDVRVPGVSLKPLSGFTDRLDDLPDGRPIHLICRSGGRSRQVADFLVSNGIDAVNVAGGTLAWVEAGYDVESGPGGG